MSSRQKFSSQKGFTLIELIMVISILGVLSAIVIPKYTAQTDRANTVKIATDLNSIDTAIMMAAANGDFPDKQDPTQVIDLLVNKGYLTYRPTPPKGFAYSKGKKTAITETAYAVTGDNPDTFRAILAGGSHCEDYR
jgi:general secretion pathway protein G